MAQKVSILIVGAGISGIGSAAKLIENGFDDIVILEAENRIGGRINSVPFGNGFIDLGAQWLIGRINNKIYEITHNNFEFGGTNFINDGPNANYRLSNGKAADTEQCSILGELFERIALNKEKMSKSKVSFGEYLDEEFWQHFDELDDKYIPKELAQMMLHFRNRELSSLMGSETLNDVSARNNVEDSGAFEGYQYQTWKDKGFRTAFDYIQKKLPDPTQDLKIECKIKFNTEVANIRWNSDKVVVKCADGAEYQADHVIFTASLGILKAHYTSLFTPELPAYKVNAIKHIGYGTLGKIFLEFEEPFWPLNSDEWTDYFFLWTKEDIEILQGTDKEWLIDIIGFSRVDGFPNLLNGLLAGRMLRDFETFDDAKIIDDCLWLLEKFMGKSLNRPVSMNRSRWLTNKNFLGSYSYFSMDAEKHEVGHEDLRKSLVLNEKPVVLFAGEATELDRLGYVHGAFASGERAAEEIIKFYNYLA